MRQFSITDPAHQVELTDISLRGVEHECSNMTDAIFDAIAELKVDEYVSMGTAHITRTADLVVP